MEIDIKDGLTWLITASGITAAWAHLKATVKGQDKRLVAVEAVMRSDDNGGAPFITRPEHDKMQEDCQKHLLSVIVSNQNHLKEVHDKLDNYIQNRHATDTEVIKAIASLEATINERIK
jgi:hypothetical protein